MKRICNKKTAEVGKSLAAIGVALIIGTLFILLAGEPPIKAHSPLMQGALDTPQLITSTIGKSTPLAFTGLAVTMGSRCDMLDTGAEDQLHVGAVVSVITALTLSPPPAPVLLVVNILAGIPAGMAADSAPGIFKARFSTNEVIMATMLNYICTLFTFYLVSGPYKTEGSTAQIELAAEEIWLGKLLPRTQPTMALFLLLFIAAAMYIFLRKTSVGYQLRAVRVNPSVADVAGIRVNLFLIMSTTLSGGIAALAGVTEVFGEYHRFVEDFSPSPGFTGIAVAILGRNYPTGALLTALLSGIMDIGSLRMSRETMVSANMVTIVQSLVVLLAVVPELTKWTRKRG